MAAQAQVEDHKPHQPGRPVSVGIYGSLGGTTSAQPTGRFGGLQGSVGVFAEYTRHSFRPGIDARLAGQGFALPSLWESSSHGTATEELVGPRLSYVKGFVHPYVEGLFGKGYESAINSANYNPSTDSTFYANGFGKYAVAGIDFATDPHLLIRFEYSAGSIGSSQGFLIQNFGTGLVFRFP